jgi:hypothetical protein
MFSLLDGSLLAIAGLREVWEKDGQRVDSLCLITTEANEVVQAAHDRMPVTLSPEARKVWLDPASDPDLLQSLPRPYPADSMTCRQVNPALNYARNEGPECLKGPVQAAMYQGRYRQEQVGYYEPHHPAAQSEQKFAACVASPDVCFAGGACSARPCDMMASI